MKSPVLSSHAPAPLSLHLSHALLLQKKSCALSLCPTFVPEQRHSLASAPTLVFSNCQGSLAATVWATELKEEWSVERGASERVRGPPFLSFPLLLCRERLVCVPWE